MSKKDEGVAYALWAVAFLGFSGLHRFYMGKIVTGIIWFFTWGLFGLGNLYDLFTIPRQVREVNRDNGYGLQSDLDAPLPRPREMSPAEKERMILHLAQRHGGRITPIEAAAGSTLSLQEAKGMLEKMVKDGYADVRVSDSGVVVYDFPGFLSSSSRNTAKTVFE